MFYFLEMKGLSTVYFTRSCFHEETISLLANDYDLSFLNQPSSNLVDLFDISTSQSNFQGLGVMVFNTTFNNTSVILWWSVLFAEETGENQRPVASH